MLQRLAVGALVGVRGVHARPDQADRRVAPGPPVGRPVGGIVRVDVHLIRDGEGLRQAAQPAVDLEVVRPAAVLDADRGVELVGGLPLAQRGHVHHDHLRQVGRPARRPAMPDFLVIGDQDDRVLGGDGARRPQRRQRAVNAGHARLVIQEAGADEAAGRDLHARIEEDEVADLDAQGAHIVGVGHPLVQANLHRLLVALGGVDAPVDVHAGVDRDHAAPVAAVVVGADVDALELDAGPYDPADAGGPQPPAALDLLDHQAQRVGVGGQAARRIGGRARHPDQQRAFARAGRAQAGHLQRGEGIFHVRYRFHVVAGRAGRVQQADQEVNQGINRDRQVRHGGASRSASPAQHGGDYTRNGGGERDRWHGARPEALAHRGEGEARGRAADACRKWSGR